MTSTTAEFQRAELLERWIIMDAASLVLAIAAELTDGMSGLEGLDRVVDELGAKEFSSLYPGEDDPDDFEHARLEALAASIMVSLSTDEARDHFAREGARLAALAAQNLKEASERARGGRDDA